MNPNQILAKCENDQAFFSEVILREPLHPGQLEYAENAIEPINCLSPGNAFGKTTLLTHLHAFKCILKDKSGYKTSDDILHAPYHTLAGSYSYPVAKAIFDKMMYYYSTRPLFKQFVKKVRRKDPPEIIFWNDAVFHTISFDRLGELAEALRFNYISYDEVGYEKKLRYLFHSLLLPRTFGVRGRIDLVGTPKPFSDIFFYELVKRGLAGEQGYYGKEGSVFDNPFCSKEDIEEKRRYYANDPEMLEQVLNGKFVLAGDFVFSPDQINAGRDDSLSYPVPPQDGHLYRGAADMGRKRDSTVIVVLDVTHEPYELVQFIRISKQRETWEGIYGIMKTQAEKYRLPYFLIDSTGMAGDILLEELDGRNVPVEGYPFTMKSKPALINHLQTALDHRIVRENKETKEKKISRSIIKYPPIPQLLQEMSEYRWNDKGLTTDSLMALALAVFDSWSAEIEPSASYQMWR